MNAKTKTLVIRFSSVGDIVLSSPLLRGLRKRFSEGQIDYATKKEYGELVKTNQNLNLTYELNSSGGFQELRKMKRRVMAEKYDLIVDIHNSIRSKYLRSFPGPQVAVVDKRVLDRLLLVKVKRNTYKEVVSVADRYIACVSGLGVENDGKGLDLHIPDEILFAVSGKIAKLTLSKYEKVIGLCPGSRHFTKRWPEDQFSKLGARLAKDEAAKILIFGAGEDAEIASGIAGYISEQCGKDCVTDFSGQFSLLETAAAMQFCDVIVTNDSGLMHIASAMHKKLVAVFGSTVREFGFFPVGTEHVIVEKNGLPCRPCSHVGRPQCPEGHFRCMRDIAVEDVHSQVYKLLHA